MHAVETFIYLYSDGWQGCWRGKNNFPLWLDWFYIIPRKTDVAAEALTV